MSDQIYYVYVYRDPHTSIPFYVGMGKGSRWRSHVNEARKYKKRNPHKEKIIREIIKTGRLPVVEFAVRDISRSEACRVEINLIQKYKRIVDGGTLTNVALGGDGGSGVHKSNPDKFTFIRIEDGYTVRRTRKEMREEFGLPAPAISNLISGKLKSSGGWCVGHVKQRSTKSDTHKFEFININGGRFFGTRREFSEYLGVRAESIQSLFSRTGSILHSGWYLSGSTLSVRSIERVKHYSFTNGDQVIRDTVGGFCKKFGLDVGNVRKMLSGHASYRQVKGWRLATPSHLTTC